MTTGNVTRLSPRCSTLAMLLAAVSLASLPVSSNAFVTSQHSSRGSNYPGNFIYGERFQHSPFKTMTATTPRYMVHNIRDADLMEMMVGGQRFEMVPLPDSMMDTTIFVGNLCEFAHDDDLSKVFQTVSRLQSVPACVVRRANMASMEYAFVAFPTVEEKEAAIMRFHGVEFMGRKLRVEEIRDDPRKGRVRVPERMVSYVVGEAKRASKRDRKSPNSISGGMRRVSRLQEPPKKQNTSNSGKLGLPPYPSEKKKTARELHRIPTATAMFSCLKGVDQDEMNRAVRRGFVSLEGLGYGTGRSKSRLASTHRQWCDELESPQIVHCKAVHDNQLDRVIVDLSPLRITSAIMGDDFDVDEFLVQWKVQIATAAVGYGMELLPTDNLQNSHCERLSSCDDEMESDCDEDDLECSVLFENYSTGNTEFILEVDEEAMRTSWQPISRLPMLTMGVFEGERSSAKAMAKQLAQLWDIPQEVDLSVGGLEGDISDSGSQSSNSNILQRGPREKRARKRENKRRRRNTRGDLSMLMRYQ